MLLRSFIATGVGSLILAGSLSAQAADYFVFGPHDCAGSGKGASVCTSSNPNGGTNSIQQLTNEYSYGFVAPSNITVIGVQLFTSTFSTTTDATTGVAFYFGATTAGTTPKTVRETLGEVLVSQSQKFYTGYFAKPISVTSGHSFWIGQGDSNLTHAAGITTGATPIRPSYWRRPPLGTTAWAVTGIVSYPSVKVLCLTNTTANAPAILTHNGLPKLGGLFDLEVRQAAGGLPVTLLLGLGKQNIDLSVIGAPNCFMLSKDDFYLAMGVTNSLGFAKMTFAVPQTGIPVGTKFYNQAFVFDALVTSRPLKITVTNAGEGTVGN